MAESQITIRIDSEALRQFRAECIRRSTTPTRQIAQYVQLQTEAWLGHPGRAAGKEQTHAVPLAVAEHRVTPQQKGKDNG